MHSSRAGILSLSLSLACTVEPTPSAAGSRDTSDEDSDVGSGGETCATQCGDETEDGTDKDHEPDDGDECETDCDDELWVDLPEGWSVLAGLRFPVYFEVAAAGLAWSQVAGPPVELTPSEFEGPLLVDIPPDVPPGSVITLRLEAERDGQVVTADITFTTVAPEPELLIGDQPAEQLGTAHGVTTVGSDMWVASSEGFVSRYNSQGAFLDRVDVGGTPRGLAVQGGWGTGDLLLIADAQAQAIKSMHLATGEVDVVTDQTIDGDPLGAVDFLLTYGDDVFFTNGAGGKVFVYDASTNSTHVFVDGLGGNPNALALGPLADAIYVGTSGQVYRVPMQPGAVTTAGEPTLYLELELEPADELSHEIDGLMFDIGGNLWVGCPNIGTLFVARSSDEGQTEVRWSLVLPETDRNRFAGLRFGQSWGSGFDPHSIYYANLDAGTVARMYVGVEGRF